MDELLRGSINATPDYLQGFTQGQPVAVPVSARLGGFGLPVQTTWALRPAASAVPSGYQIIVTDVGVGGRSYWWSDGAIWRPVNGRVMLYSQQATMASPLASLAGNGTAQIFTLPVTQSIPAGMLQPGFRLWGSCRIRRTALAGAPVTINGIGVRVVDANTNAAWAAAHPIAQQSLGAGTNQTLDGCGFMDFTGVNTQISGSFLVAVMNNSPVANYLNATFNTSNQLFVTVGVGTEAITGDTLVCNNAMVWLEG